MEQSPRNTRDKKLFNKDLASTIISIAAVPAIKILTVANLQTSDGSQTGGGAEEDAWLQSDLLQNGNNWPQQGYESKTLSCCFKSSVLKLSLNLKKFNILLKK